MFLAIYLADHLCFTKYKKTGPQNNLPNCLERQYYFIYMLSFFLYQYIHAFTFFTLYEIIIINLIFLGHVERKIWQNASVVEDTLIASTNVQELFINQHATMQLQMIRKIIILNNGQQHHLSLHCLIFKTWKDYILST